MNDSLLLVQLLLIFTEAVLCESFTFKPIVEEPECELVLLLGYLLLNLLVLNLHLSFSFFNLHLPGGLFQEHRDSARDAVKKLEVFITKFIIKTVKKLPC